MSRGIFSPFYLAIIMICVVSNNYGQKIEITKDRFIEIYNPMIAKTENRSRRINFISEQYFTGRDRKSTVKKIIEIVPPDKSFFDSYYDDVGEYISKTIFIGNTMYHKLIESRGIKSNDTWEIKEVGENFHKQNLWNLPAPLKLEEVKWFLTENIEINGQMSDLIEGVHQKDFKSKNEKTQSMEDYRILGEWKYWVNKDNLLIKFEHYQGSNLFNEINLKVTYNYEYDPKIKIEAPIK